MGDVMNIANLVSDLDLFRPFRQLLGMRDLKALTFLLWQSIIIRHLFHEQSHVLPKSLLQL